MAPTPPDLLAIGLTAGQLGVSVDVAQLLVQEVQTVGSCSAELTASLAVSRWQSDADLQARLIAEAGGRKSGDVGPELIEAGDGGGAPAAPVLPGGAPPKTERNSSLEDGEVPGSSGGSSSEPPGTVPEAVAAFPNNSTVIIEGLKTNTDLNGRPAIVIGQPDANAPGRYVVKTGESVVRIRAGNIVLAPEPPKVFPAPAPFGEIGQQVHRWTSPTGQSPQAPGSSAELADGVISQIGASDSRWQRPWGQCLGTVPGTVPAGTVLTLPCWEPMPWDSAAGALPADRASGCIVPGALSQGIGSQP